MKDWKYILRLTLVLFLITAVVAGLLGLVNELTADRIAENTAKKAQEAMRQVLPAEEYTALEVVGDDVSEVYECDEGFVIRLSVNGFGGEIDMMVGVNRDFAVTGIAIVSHGETASLGANCTREDWQAQFVGVSETQSVSKDGGKIDALTGATITSRAVTEGVNRALAYAKEVLE